MTRPLAVALVFAGVAVAQTMHRPGAQSSTTDAMGNLKTAPLPPGRARVSGTVRLADGSVPRELVDIYAQCGSGRALVANADAKGRFSVSAQSLEKMTGMKACELRAFLEGYRSAAKALKGGDQKVGELVLDPLSPSAAGLASAADEQADKAQRKEYAKALDEASGTDFEKAIATLRKVTAADPGYASAWLTMGLLQLGGGDKQGALKSFRASIQADPKFAPPLVQAAFLESAAGDWNTARDDSQKAIDLNPAAFPDAWALNALGNLSLGNTDAAEKSAREGLKLDPQHEYPELEYALGSVLAGKQEDEEARRHLQAYLALSPQGPNADAARSTVAEMSLAPAGTATVSSPAASPASAPLAASGAGSGPPLSALSDRNAPMLVKTPDYTCLESITRTRIDKRGSARDADLVRVEIGMSDDREIYGYAGGKRFSGEGLAALLGNSFSTTGVFSVLARALMAGNGVEIAFAGGEVLNGEPVYRYNFRSVGGARWSIQYGRAFGRAGEEGSFFVEREHLTLRRVEVRAMGIPPALKLKALNAVVDYEPETLAGRVILLPWMAEVDTEGGEIGNVSRMFFDHCRTFGSESTVVFEGDAPSAAADHRELSADLNIQIALTAPVSVSSAEKSDVLKAVVAAPVTMHGHEIIAAGAAVEGHVRPCRGEHAVVLEFDRVETNGGWQPFYAHVDAVASNQAAVDSGKKSDPEIPGVVKMIFTGGSAELAAGTKMRWTTESLVASSATAQPELGTRVGVH